MQRQQFILQQLGIQRWASRGAMLVEVDQSNVWRDETAQSTALETIVLPSISQKSSIQNSQHQQLSASTPKQILSSLTDESISPITISPIINHSSPDVLSSDTIPVPSPTIASQMEHDTSTEDNLQEKSLPELAWHVVQHEQFILLAQVEQHDEFILLQNIQKACYAELSELRWPLLIAEWEISAISLSAYLQGYFYQQQHKLLIIFGNCTIPELDGLFQQRRMMPSLADFLQHAAYKQQLWQTLYPLIYETV